jgi:DNA-binding transcriptional MerR regulator
MKERRWYQIKEAANMAGVSVRTLHHYDHIGLLTPTERSAAGYRLYSNADLLRLQQILIGRELGLPLEVIRQSLDDPTFDHRQALKCQKVQLQARARQTDAMLRAIDAAIVILDNEISGESMPIATIFDGFDPSAYEDEVGKSWGHTEAFQMSANRTKHYSREDWNRIHAEQSAIYDDAASAMTAGKTPEDSLVFEIVERHRAFIDRWFYPCTAAMHAALADLYDSDARFAQNIDKHRRGLTAFLSAAIKTVSQGAGTAIQARRDELPHG